MKIYKHQAIIREYSKKKRNYYSKVYYSNNILNQY